TFSFNNFIVGKGLGFNVLIYGLLGIGKTLATKVLSEYFRVLLYIVYLYIFNNLVFL
ncbi:hypothetical protein BGZ57DRAFT_778950, partial [Hyaloscypha finlandica]